ncbi:MAG: hypothetical protein M1814_005332 [Vezdaea aestivalis]|nr:MAG: hypothetical protein M1814_005332 [Vezdaea aestivalis]
MSKETNKRKTESTHRSDVLERMEAAGIYMKTGLLPKAFTKEELEKLRNYASVEHPIFVTPTICFPFLMCEAKSADVGISVADRQNIHSASIAVKVIIDLYKVAFNADPGRINELYGKILVFTVSHDHDKIQLCGHYATLGGDSGQTLEFYRHVIAFYSLAVDDGEQIFKPYNFVWNVYKSFVPHHLKRIQVAVEKLDKMEPRTGASFDMSQMGMGETNSQSNPEGQMLPPPVPDSEASQLQRQFEQKEAELQRELKQKEAELQRELKQKEAELQRQLKKTEADHKEERRKDREAAEKQREDTKKQMDSLVKQLEQQNKQMERLMKLVEKKV